MRVGQLAEKTGVSRDTIRLYEQMEMLINITRPSEYNNYKDYANENVERIQMILTMKKFGLTLKECKYVLSVIENEEYDQGFHEEFILKKVKELDEKIKELQLLRGTFLNFLNMDCDKHSSKIDLDEIKNASINH
ncbi:MerR family transcriptional regulator [Flammeovirga sp. SJP92]|uniref:MerR family transcriptional regulator n=1 Tax=Flammeovirga sp. SJP92 TaxID=1775430 RepID=UPI00078845CD|nr:MerR family transcriptional regulator [Flammeovirga sp. SJP92]KXX67679.1 hypothetical protein AVL50_24715 [Flammeovirga sp. SJP92]